MGNFRQSTSGSFENEPHLQTPANAAANQIAIAAADLIEWTDENRETAVGSLVFLNMSTGQFMTDIAEAIREDRLVILDHPRNGREIMLTPAAQTFREQLREAPEARVQTIADLNRMMGMDDDGED